MDKSFRIPLRYRFLDWLDRVKCYFFHRKFWDWQTYGGTYKGRHFHHAQVCSECEQVWPEYYD